MSMTSLVWYCQFDVSTVNYSDSDSDILVMFMLVNVCVCRDEFTLDMFLKVQNSTIHYKNIYIHITDHYFMASPDIEYKVRKSYGKLSWSQNSTSSPWFSSSNTHCFMSGRSIT